MNPFDKYINERDISLTGNDFYYAKKCPACSSQNIVDLGDIADRIYINKKIVNIEAMGNKLIRCTNCGLVRKNLFLQVQTEKVIQAIWINEDENFQRWIPQKEKEIVKTVNFIRERIEKYFSVSDKRSILDIGIGDGGFIKLFRDQFDTYGMDIARLPSVDYSNIVNRKILFCDIQEEIENGYDEYFHIVTAMDVFEHLSNPNRALMNIHSLLRKDGILIIETGNIESFPSKWKKYSKWWYVSVLEHKVFWSENTISEVLKKNGFSVLETKRKKHKGTSRVSIRRLTKFIIQYVSPRLWNVIASKFNLNRFPIGSLKFPYKDHILIIAKKVSK